MCECECERIMRAIFTVGLYSGFVVAVVDASKGRYVFCWSFFRWTNWINVIFHKRYKLFLRSMLIYWSKRIPEQSGAWEVNDFGTLLFLRRTHFPPHRFCNSAASLNITSSILSTYATGNWFPLQVCNVRIVMQLQLVLSSKPPIKLI